MILKKEEKNDIITVLYDSSNIVSSTYHVKTKILYITFKNGGVFKYHDVPKTDYTRFEISDSHGKALNSYIKKYDYTKVEVIDIKSLTKEIDELKNNERNEMLLYKSNEILNLFGIINETKNNGTLRQDDNLHKLGELIINYNKL